LAKGPPTRRANVCGTGAEARLHIGAVKPMSSRPIVSVIVPYYNRLGLVRRALASVLGQTISDIEIIMVDDASSDDSAIRFDVGTALPITYLRHENRRGAAVARNTGAENSRGKYLSFLDSDDVWSPVKLERQLEYMESPESLPLCCTGFAYQRLGAENGEVRIPQQPTAALGNLAFGCRLSPGTTLCTTAAHFRRVGGFDAEFPRLEDWDWLIRASQLTPIALVQEPLATIYQSGWPGYSVVVGSTRRLYAKHFETFRFLGPWHAKRFCAALEIEAAAAAFYEGRSWTAWRHLGRSFWAYPWRNIDSIRRLIEGRVAYARRGLRVQGSE
jgi:glycosyltransferase involved in cell wall biosynthesis